jgi:carbamoyltransferase
VIVVGISGLYHDAACAILVDGELKAAAQEERFTGVRFDPSMPVNAFRACLRQAGISIHDIDHVAYYEDPVLRLGRQLWMGLPELPPATPETLFRFDADRPFREIRERLGYDGPVTTVRHHEAHAASAFYYSGFEESALLTADAVGEWATTTYGRGGPDGVELFESVDFPHSLGLLYSVLTSYLGFAVNSDEYKVMGLAPYGRPRHLDLLRGLLTDLPGGQFRLEQEYFNFDGREPMYSPKLTELLGVPPRSPSEPIETFHEDLASSLQVLLEEELLRKVKWLHEVTGSPALGYAGGVALNCTANSRLRREGPFRDIFVQPAAGDAGGCLGAAAIVHHRLTGTPTRKRLTDVRLGPAYDSNDVRVWLAEAQAQFTDFEGRQQELLTATAELLAQGQVVGWFQGRMEFGPRALGGRSILADPRNPGMRDHINGLVKKREAFRPFAPAVAAERCAEFFDFDGSSPFMLDTAQVKQATRLPAITHVDGSARLQTVDRQSDPLFHGLLSAFGRLTGCPVLLNTSFNMRGDPIVCDPADALVCFVRSGLDVLVLDDLMLKRESIPDVWHVTANVRTTMPDQTIRSDVYTFI